MTKLVHSIINYSCLILNFNCKYYSLTVNSEKKFTAPFFFEKTFRSPTTLSMIVSWPSTFPSGPHPDGIYDSSLIIEVNNRNHR